MSNSNNDKLIDKFGFSVAYNLNLLWNAVHKKQQLTIGMKASHSYLGAASIDFVGTKMAKVADNKLLYVTLNEMYFEKNKDDFYFTAAEVAANDNSKYILGIVGNYWYKNIIDDEFVEAIIFGEHTVGSIDCFLCSVKANSPFKRENYYKVGTLVLLKKDEFQNTKYYKIETALTPYRLESGGNQLCNISSAHTLYRKSGDHYSKSAERIKFFDEIRMRSSMTFST